MPEFEFDNHHKRKSERVLEFDRKNHLRLRMNLWILVGFFLMVSACGMKGPPKPPRKAEPPIVNDLSYVIENQSVKLSWTIPQKDGKRPANLAGFKIYRMKQTFAEAECKTCPPEFEELWDLPIVDKRSGEAQQDKMEFSDSLEPGYRYVYKVAAYLDDGAVGNDSNVVDFKFGSTSMNKE